MKTIFIYKVTTTKQQSWTGAADSFDAASKIAQDIFLCPPRSIKKIEIVNIID